jgi:NADP-dependent 3-hydroxy acid dehydrogenase YdfG
VVATCRRSRPELESLQAEAAAAAAGNAAGRGESATAASPAAAALQIVEGIDVSDDACVPALRAALAGTRVGLLICNAGALSVDSVLELDTATMRRQVRVPLLV